MGIISSNASLIGTQKSGTTKNHQRCILSNHEHLVDFPPSKKPRITSMPSSPDGPSFSSSQPSGILISKRSLQPLLPLQRQVHAPQRSSKFPWLGNQIGGGMGTLKGIFGCFCGWLSPGSHSQVSRRRDAADTEQSQDAGVKGFTAEEFDRLFEAREGSSVVLDWAMNDVGFGMPTVLDSHFQPSSSATVPDLTVWNQRASEGKTGDVAPVVYDVEEEMWIERPPAYKELYESSRKHNSKLNSLEFELELTEQKLSSFRIAEQAVKAKEDVYLKPFIPLTYEEEDLVSRALFGTDRKKVLVVHESSNIQITGEILLCLRFGAWLNDEVINLYLELLKERERREPKKFLKCHFFNTFFYQKLFSGRFGYDFKAVRRWTTQKKIGYNLVECDKIFVPIHKKAHWCLAIINVKDEKFEYLDSLRGRDTQVLRVLARYFMDEVKDKSDKDIDVSLWKQEFVDNLPKQQNGFDCGVFMIKYADFYSQGLKLCFTQDHISYFRKRTAKEILMLRAE